MLQNSLLSYSGSIQHLRIVLVKNILRSIWFLMRKYVGSTCRPYLPILVRKAVPCRQRATVVESWGLVRMAMNGSMRTSYIYTRIRVPDEFIMYSIIVY